MFSKIPWSSQIQSQRYMSISYKTNFKVAVAGASGGVGQPLCLLLKQCSLVKKLAMYDLIKTTGIGLDLSHIETESSVLALEGMQGSHCAFENANVIIFACGVPRQPGMDRNDLFKKNAAMVRDLTRASATVAPSALIGVVTNPVNSLVPVVCETLEKFGVPKPNKVFGITTIDCVRANAFVGMLKKKDPKTLSVPVIGGHSDTTIVPLLSQIYPAGVTLKEEEIKKLTKRIRTAGTEIAKAKKGKGTATLSVAYSTAKFVASLLRGLSGERDVVDTAFVKSEVTDAGYFANPLLLGKNGIEKNLCIGGLSSYERELVEKAVPIIKADVVKGQEFVSGGEGVNE